MAVIAFFVLCFSLLCDGLTVWFNTHTPRAPLCISPILIPYSVSFSQLQSV